MTPSASDTQMELILWRHAEAEDGLPDAARALTKRGRKQAKAMASWLRPLLMESCEILVSPATRTQQTAEALDLPRTPTRQVGVGASVAAVLQAAGWPLRGGMVVIVGHQPTLGRVASSLLAGTEADWVIKKGAIWWLSTRARDGAGQVVLRAVMSPDLL